MLDVFRSARSLRCAALAVAAVLAVTPRVGIAVARTTVPTVEPLVHGTPGILGRQGNRDAGALAGAISADGQRVVFASASDNLDAADRDGRADVYLADAAAGTTRVLSRMGNDLRNRQIFALSISAEGRWVAWVVHHWQDGINTFELVLHDTVSGSSHTLLETAPAPDPRGMIVSLDLAQDAQFVVFGTSVSLDPIDDGAHDLYLWSRATETFHLVSRRADGTRFGRVDVGAALSRDGRLVAFPVNADPALPGSTSAVLVVDSVTGAVDRIVSPDGGPLTPLINMLALSADGRFVALTTNAALLPGDLNGDQRDVYLFDRQLRVFELVSVDSGGVVGDCHSESPSVSADGARVAFVSCAGNFHPGADGSREIYVRDRPSGQTLLLTRPLDGRLPSGHVAPRDNSFYWTLPSISDDGSQVAFASAAPELVKGDSNRRADVFRVALPGRTTERLGLASGGPRVAGASIGPLAREIRPRAFASRSADTVAFNVQADNLLPTRREGALRVDSRTGAVADASLLFDTPGPRSIEVVDGLSDDGQAVLVRRSSSPVDYSGIPQPPAPIPPRDLWVQRAEGSLYRIDVDPILGSQHAVQASAISGDGQRVAFTSLRLEGDWPLGVYVFDRATGATRRVDRLASGGEPAVNAEVPIALSRNGRWLAFASRADGLVAGDADLSADLFLADLDGDTVIRLRQPTTGLSLLARDDFGFLGIAVSDDGQRVLFTSSRTDLAPGGPGRYRLFQLDRGPGSLRRLDHAGPDAIAADPSISADGRVVGFVDDGRLRVLVLDDAGATVSEPTLQLPAIAATHAAVSPDGYAVAVMSKMPMPWLPGWVSADVSVPYLLRLPEPAQFQDGFEP